MQIIVTLMHHPPLVNDIISDDDGSALLWASSVIDTQEFSVECLDMH